MFRKRMKRLGKTARGSALILTMIFVAIFGIVIAAVLTDVQQETRAVQRTRLMTNSLEAAKSSVRGMVNNVRELAFTRPPQLSGSIGNLNSVIKSIEPVIPQGAIEVQNGGKPLTYVRDLGPNDGQYRTIEDDSDPYYKYSIMRLDYEMVSFLSENTNNRTTLGMEGMGARSRVTVNYIPLYQYAIFYDPELEIFPGPKLVVSGKVHSNQDLYLTGNTEYRSTVTSAGNIFQFRNINSTSKKDGTVSIWDATNTARSTQPDNNPNDSGDWLDHEDPNWRDDAISRWSSRVEDSAMGIQPIKPPLPTGSGTIDMISRVKSTDTEEVKKIKFEAKSDLVISGDPGNLAGTLKIKVQQFDASGNVVSSSTFPSNPTSGGQSLVTVGEFYDGQQLTVVKTLDVNMKVLKALQDAGSITGLDFTSGSGAVYVTTTPGVGDTYTLAAANKDPNYKIDADGNILFNMATSGSNIIGYPQLTTGGSLGWVAGPTEAQFNTSPVDTAYMPAVRIIRGEEVPSNVDKGFGIYSDRPIYVVGNLNTTNKKVLVVGGDSITVTDKKLELGKKRAVVSGVTDRWATLDSTGATISGTNADGTKRGLSVYMGADYSNAYYDWAGARVESTSSTITTNAILLMGNTPTIYDSTHKSKQISGGAHNVVRYLEKWGTHNINGSMIVLFHSHVGMRWFRDDSYAGNKLFRNPPTRNYSWDPSLRDAVPPPGMPIVIDVNTFGLDPIDLDYAKAHQP